MEDKKPRQQADWTLIEVDYRAGVKSLEQIGKEYGVTKGRISQVAKKQGWTRDLQKRIQAKADAKVNEAAVNAALNEPKRRLAEQDVVEANAELQYRIRMEHRQDIGRTRRLFQSLIGEVEIETSNLELFQRLGELMDRSGEDDDGRQIKDKLNEIYQKVISTTGRVDSAKKLTEILEKVVKLEREAFGLDLQDQKVSEVDDLLKKIISES